MAIYVHPAYTQDIAYLHSNVQELIATDEIDFSISEKTWVDTAKTVALFVLKIVLFPWALYEAVQWCFQRLIMTFIYPAQSWIVKKCFSAFQTESLDQTRIEAAWQLEQEGFIVRHIGLEKDGVRASGLLIGKPETIQNGKWVLQATGNAQPIEHDSLLFARKYQRADYNVLLVNNPGVGRSEGLSTPETIGKCQETAICFLETALKAHKIVLAGYSLGGASIGEAILRHDFAKSQADFFVVRQVTFGRASEVAAERAPRFHVPGCLARSLTRWTGCEMDNVESSKKLADLQIPEAVIQAGGDQLIVFETSLMHDLQKEGIVENKEFHILPSTAHMDANKILNKTVNVIRAWEEAQPLQLAE